MRRLLNIAAAAALASLGSVHANQITQTNNVSPLDLDFDPVPMLSFGKFNPVLGTLNFVELTLQGTVAGDIQAENRSTGSGSTITGQLSAILTLQSPLNAPLVVTIPTQTEQYIAARYDNQFDFGGTSGVSWLNQSKTDSNSAVIDSSSPADFNLFIGPGNIVLPLSGIGNTVVSFNGGGGFTRITSQAFGSATITYDYTPSSPVPEPETWALMAAGLWVVCWLRARRRA